MCLPVREMSRLWQALMDEKHPDNCSATCGMDEAAQTLATETLQVKEIGIPKAWAIYYGKLSPYW